MENKFSTNRRKGGVTTVAAGENKKKQEEENKNKPQSGPPGDKAGKRIPGKGVKDNGI